MALPTPGVTPNWGEVLNAHLTSGQDADIAAYVNDPASQVRAGLSATYAAKADHDALALEAATIENLAVTAQLNEVALSASGSWPLFVCPFPLKVVAVSVIHWDGPTTITAGDNNNRWIVTLDRWRANVSANIAAKSTGAGALDEAWNKRTDWNFDAATFNATNQVCDKGDIIGIGINKVGTPAAPAKVYATVRFEPI